MICRTVSWSLAAILVLDWTPKTQAAEELTADSFAGIHKLIKPQAGESRWLEIPWLTDVWEARRKAAAEGKPILIWSGGGAAPIGGC